MNATLNFNAIERATPADFKEITAVWEASVRATHHFLKEDDILFFKPLIENEYLYVVKVFCIKDEHNNIIGFLGTTEDKVEMLFIHPDGRGKGTGKKLLKYAVEVLGIKKVDVNKQNEQAVGFYKHFGFEEVGYSEKDSMGKPYPMLYMALM